MRFKTFLLLISLLLIGSVNIFAQNDNSKNLKKAVKTLSKDTKAKPELSKKEVEGMRIAETSIVVYSGFTGRSGLNRIRKTTTEFGKMELTNPDGTKTEAYYERRILRGESLNKERIRIDQTFPSAKYALIYNDDKIFGMFNKTSFTPREDASKSFQNKIWHGLEALLRYRENGSKVIFEKEEKILGVNYFVITVTDKENRTTTFYTSKKSLRVLMLEYESEGVKFRRKFYNHNYAQGTLVPYRTVLWADDKWIEESEIKTITYGQIVGEELFKSDS